MTDVREPQQPTRPSAAEVIREARNLLFERGWTQHVTEDDDGHLCLIRALNLAAGEGLGRVASIAHPGADKAIASAVDDRVAFGWNDEPGRTFGEVIDILDKAEKFAEAAAGGGVL